MRRILVSAIALSLLAPPASAQRGVGAAAPMRAPDPVPAYREPIRPNTIEDLTAVRREVARRDQAQTRAAAEAEALSQAQQRETQRLTRIAIDAAYERDALGRWYRRGEIAVATTLPGAVEAARALGLSMTRGERLEASGLLLYTFAVPAGSRTDAVFAAFRSARPDDAVDLNFVYDFEGAQTAAATGPSSARASAGRRIAAVIDSALPEGDPALGGVAVRVQRFGPGFGRISAHALAVAAVLADTAGHEGLTLLAADVSESGPLPGASATAIAQALDWSAASGAQVVNISLTGPPNAVLAAVVRRIAAKGVVIVAAAGNDGPRAQPPYPAALPGVIAVTAVDRNLRIWRRATQGPHVAFAAQGVKVAAAGGEWTGTSLATPVVAGVLLRTLETPQTLAREVRDLGAPGRDPVFGFGFVAGP